AVGLDDLSKRKCSADDRFEVSAGKMVKDVSLGLQELVWKFIRVRHDLEERIGFDRKVLAEGDVEWVGGRFICQNSVLEDETAGSGRRSQVIKPLTCNRIEDNTRALAAGDRVDTFRQVFFIGHDDMIGAEFQELRLLRSGASGGDADSSLKLRGFNGGDTNTAARGGDDNKI